MAATDAPIRVPVTVACRVLGLSSQGYYKWLKEPVSQRDWDDAHLIDVILDVHSDDATLGYRFITDELGDEHGIHVGENRVHRLCRIAGISASHHKVARSKAGATGPAPHDDLLAVVNEHGVVRHEFIADGPNKVWLWDISEHPTREGKLYICAIKDVWSNKIVGYSIDTRMKSSLAMAAMRNAIALRSPEGTICHSDRGGQGGFNWSSQHLEWEACDGTSSAGCGSGDQAEIAVAGASEVPTPRRGCVLGRDRQGADADRGCCGCRRGARGRAAVVPPRWRDAAIRSCVEAFGQVSVVSGT